MFFPAGEWFAAFVLTLAVEVPIAVAILRGARPPRPGVARLAGLASFANLASHPLVWFVFTQLFLVGTTAYTVAAEGWALGIEALFYAVALPGIGMRRVVGASLACNVASYLAGRLLWQALPSLLS